MDVILEEFNPYLPTLNHSSISRRPLQAKLLRLVAELHDILVVDEQHEPALGCLVDAPKGYRHSGRESFEVRRLISLFLSVTALAFDAEWTPSPCS